MKPKLLTVLFATAASSAFAQSTSCPPTGSLNYTVSSLPVSAYQMLLQQPNGTFDLLLWSEGNGGATQVNVNSPAQIYDPMTGTDPISVVTAGPFTVQLTDHPIVVAVKNGGSGGTPAKSTATITGMIGFDSHIAYGNTVYANVPLELKELAYVGSNLIRDQAPSAGSIGSYQQLASAGVNMLLITSPGGQDVRTTLPIDIANIEALEQSSPGHVVGVEGPNELNGDNAGQGQIVYLDGAPSYQPAVGRAIVDFVSQSVHASKVIGNKPVVNVSINNCCQGWANYVTGLGDLAPPANVANWHVYFGGPSQPRTNILSMFANAQQTAPGMPVAFTEIGWPTATASPYGVNYQIQATHSLNAVADAAQAGVKWLFFYELMDGATSATSADTENNYGFFQTDGTAKPVATGLHNLIAILGGPTTAACVSTSTVSEMGAGTTPTTAPSPEQTPSIRWTNLPTSGTAANALQAAAQSAAPVIAAVTAPPTQIEIEAQQQSEATQQQVIELEARIATIQTRIQDLLAIKANNGAPR